MFSLLDDFEHGWRSLECDRLILFDIDGTLLDTGGAGSKAFRAALSAEYGIAHPHGAEMNGRTDLGILHELLTANALAATPSHIDRLRGRYFQLLADMLPQLQGRVLPGVELLLNRLREHRHIAVGLLTGNDPKSAWMKLSHYGIQSYFEWGVFGHQHRDRLALGRSAASTLTTKFEPKNMVVVGDTPLDIACAREIGCLALAVATGKYSVQQLVVHSPDRLERDLSQTDAIVDWLIGPPQGS